jgi:hypothetical protein
VWLVLSRREWSRRRRISAGRTATSERRRPDPKFERFNSIASTALMVSLVVALVAFLIRATGDDVDWRF